MPRRHRRVRTSWSGCGCPEGATQKPSRNVERGWVCVKPTPKGPRFVRAVCKTPDGGAASAQPASGRKKIRWVAATPTLPAVERPRARRAAPAPADCDPPVVRVEVPVLTSSAPADRAPRKRKSRAKADPQQCTCQAGSMMRDTKQGVRCFDPRLQRFTKMRCAS